MRIGRVILALAIFSGQAHLAAQSPGPSSDWLHCRGPGYDGHAATNGIRWPWPLQGPPVLWRTTVESGYSGIVATGGRIYSQVQNLSGQYLICLDLKNGRELWRTRYDWPWQPDSEWPGTYGTPTLAEGRVYFTDCFGAVLCADASSGRIIWSVNLKNKFDADPPGFGYAITPLVLDGAVIVPVGGAGHAVVAFSTKDGRVLWQSGDDEASYSSCIRVIVDGMPQVVTYLEHIALGLDPRTGTELWHFRWGQQYGPHGTWPLYQEPFLFYALPFRFGCHALELRRITNGVQANVAWTNGAISMDLLSGVVVDGFIYGFDVRDFQSRANRPTSGLFKCVELATGAQRWTSSSPGHASVLACGKHLILLNERGLLLAVEANPEAYRELSRIQIFPPQTCWTAPAICGDLLLARSQAEFVCLSLGSTNRMPAVPGVLGGGTLSRRSNAGSWFARHYSNDFCMPAWRVQVRWFIANLFGVFAPAALLVSLAIKLSVPPRIVFYGSAMGLSFFSTWALTELFRSFIFTWPAAIFLALFLLLELRAWALASRSQGRGLLARGGLVFLACILIAYAWICRRLFIVAGYSYLPGLLVAAPFAVWTINATGDQTKHRTFVIRGLSAFSFFFWSSAIVLWWKNR